MNQKAATIQSSISISQFGEQKVKNNMRIVLINKKKGQG
jgi:hypothetical protein